MQEIRNTMTDEEYLDGLICRLVMTEKEISELENMTGNF